MATDTTQSGGLFSMGSATSNIAEGQSTNRSVPTQIGAE